MIHMSNDGCDKPVVKLFISAEQCYVYDVYSNRILEVTKEQYRELNRLVEIGVAAYLSEAIESSAYQDVMLLLQKGYFRAPWVEKIQHPESRYISTVIKRGITFMSLQITKDCNFKCRYCLFTRENKIDRSHEKVMMSWDIAKASVDFLWRNSKDSAKINIAFYGGEPLLNFDLIRNIVDYADRIFETKKVTYSLTTNGSIITDSIIDFFADHDFNISISLDGPETLQNRHRKFYVNGNDTFSVVWANVVRMRTHRKEWFTEHVLFHPVLMSNEHPEIVFDFFEKTGIPRNRVVLNLANLSGIDFDNSDVDFIYQSKNIAGAQSESVFRNAQARFNENIRGVGIIPVEWHHSGPCMPAGKKIFIDTKGSIYPCEKLVESNANCIGNIADGIDEERVYRFLNIGLLTEHDCKQCFAMRFCSICVQNCYDPETDEVDVKQKERRCEMIRKRTLQYLKRYCSDSAT